MTSERCAAFRDDLAAYRAEALNAQRQAEHDAHLAACAACAAALAGDVTLDGLLGDLPAGPALAVSRLLSATDALTAPTPPAPTPLPWAWIAAVGFALLAALTADWSRAARAPARPRDPWRYHAPPNLDRDELPHETTQPAPGHLTWRVP